MYRVKEWLTRVWIELRLLGGLLAAGVRRLFGAGPDANEGGEPLGTAWRASRKERPSDPAIRLLAERLRGLPDAAREEELRELRRRDALTYLRVRRALQPPLPPE